MLGSHVVTNMRIVALALVALLAAACASSAPKATATIPAPRSTSAPALALMRHPLLCHARAASARPRDHTTVGIRVRTVASAWVIATAPSLLSGESASGRASVKGKRMLRFRVGAATPGAPVVIDVRVSRHGKKGSCQISFLPRSALATAVAPTQPAASPTPTPASPPPTQAPPPPPTAASCYPLSNEGTCYEPGEFCRESDHGVSGVAGDGEKIICANNDGWRWEPA